jgi:hypothetical protein
MYARKNNMKTVSQHYSLHLLLLSRHLTIGMPPVGRLAAERRGSGRGRQQPHVDALSALGTLNAMRPDDVMMRR